MGRRHRRRHQNILKFQRPVKHGGHEEHEADLHKLRRLEGEAPDVDGELRPVAGISQKPHRRQKRQPQNPVDPRDFAQLPHPVDDVGDDPGDHRGRRRDHKLTRRLARVQPRHHNEADAQTHAGIVHQKPGHVPVKQPVQVDVTEEKHKLPPEEHQHLHVLSVQIEDHIGQDVQQEHGKVLPPAEAVFPLLVRNAEKFKIVIRVNRYEQYHQIL